MMAVNKKLIKEIGKCELCGSKRNLEVHHCVPQVYKDGFDLDFDSEDNCIVVCGVCHAKLTPKKFLCQLGKEKKKRQLLFYERAEKQVTCATDLLDLVDCFFFGKGITNA